MTKLLSGAPINYGPLLPPVSAQTNGALFFKTKFDPDGFSNEPGLYVLSFASDISSTLGEQIGFAWVLTSPLTRYVARDGSLPMFGPLTITPGAGIPALQISSATPGIRLTEIDQPANSQDWLVVADSGIFQVQSRSDNFATSASLLKLDRTGELRIVDQLVWHEGNDGPGSTLDADTLDGQHASAFISRASLEDVVADPWTIPINTRTSGVLGLSRGGTNMTTAEQGGVVYASSASVLATITPGPNGYVLASAGAASPAWVDPSLFETAAAGTLMNAGVGPVTRLTFDYTPQSGQPTYVWGSNDGSTTLVWNPANFSVDSAAYLVVGGASRSGSVPTAADSVVVRDGAGAINVQTIISASTVDENPTVSQFIVTNAADGTYRKASVAFVGTTLGLSNYVVKTGDVISGSLAIGSAGGHHFQVNGLTIDWATSALDTSGAITADGIITGAGFNASNSAITNVSTPVAASDAATKGYVDTVGLAAASSACPIGSIIMWPVVTPPPMFLALEADFISKVDFPILHALLDETGGVDTFVQLPDMRGMFPRGFDHGRGIDVGRQINTEQDDAIQNITGWFGADDRAVNATGNVANNPFYDAGAGHGGPDSTAQGGDGVHVEIGFDASRSVRTAAETRPKNRSLLFAIKAALAPFTAANLIRQSNHFGYAPGPGDFYPSDWSTAVTSFPGENSAIAPTSAKALSSYTFHSDGTTTYQYTTADQVVHVVNLTNWYAPTNPNAGASFFVSLQVVAQGASSFSSVPFSEYAVPGATYHSLAEGVTFGVEQHFLSADPGTGVFADAVLVRVQFSSRADGANATALTPGGTLRPFIHGVA